MSASAGDTGQDVELNLAPIIDCFTVLITYLLVSASFISLSVLDVGVSASGAGAAAAPAGTPPLNLSLKLAADQSMEFHLTGGDKHLDEKMAFPRTAQGGWDMVELAKRLKYMKTKYPTLKEVSLSADPTVHYKDVVKMIEATRKSMPKVYLAG